MNEITKCEGVSLTPENAEVVAAVVREMITPIFQSIGKMLEHNTQAMEQIAAAQQLTSDRIAALEKEVRLNTPMSAKQAQYVNDAIRSRARALLDKWGYADDRKAVTKLSNAIRKSVLARFGIGTLREIPKHQYEVALNQTGMWSDMLIVKDITKEARARAEEAMAAAEPSAGVDGSPQAPGPVDQ